MAGELTLTALFLCLKDIIPVMNISAHYGTFGLQSAGGFLLSLNMIQEKHWMVLSQSFQCSLKVSFMKSCNVNVSSLIPVIEGISSV